MSPLARTLLELCDENLTIDLARVWAYYPEYSFSQVLVAARKLGLHIPGDC